MAGSETRVGADELRCFCSQVLQRMGAPEDDAEGAADCLVEADMRGIAGHGTARLPIYVRHIRAGGCNPKPDIRTVRDFPAAALLDGDNGLGQVAGIRAMNLAVEKARGQGSATVAVRNSGGLGALAYFSLIAVKHDMIGFTTLSTTNIIAPPGSLIPTIGNSPMAFAIPAGKERPVVFDMALTVASAARCRTAAMEGRKIPFGWALDREGRPTDDPAVAYEGLLLPMGGYKGYGMAVVMGLLTSVLSGGAIGDDIIGIKEPARPSRVSQLFMAINVASFGPVDEFKSRADEFIRQQKSAPAVPGHDPVRVPGEGSWATRDERLKNGIPMHHELLTQLQNVGKELGITTIGC